MQGLILSEATMGQMDNRRKFALCDKIKNWLQIAGEFFRAVWMIENVKGDGASTGR